MFSSLLTYIGVPILIRVLGESLNDVDHPSAKGAARALQEMNSALSTGKIDPAILQINQGHMQKMIELEAAHFEVAMKEINGSLRAEIASTDAYVRRMRPTFGYLMAVTWTAQMLALAYVVTFKTEHSHLVLDAMGSLGTIWTVGLSVLGIYIYKRSEDKKAPYSRGEAFDILGSKIKKISSIIKSDNDEAQGNESSDSNSRTRLQRQQSSDYNA